MRARFAAGSIVAIAVGLAACGGSKPETKAAPGGSTDPSHWPADDRSMCDWHHPELDVSETAGPGALKPNVRRVYKTLGEADQRHRTLVCREIDTNLDGIKDVVRTFNAKGEATREDADTDYDGKIDSWITFVGGRMSEEDLDTHHWGRPDTWKFYTDGVISRARRDRNNDGKPDVWEIYTNGHLERIGYDDDYDGHVDRWDRDDQIRLDRESAADNAASGGADAGSTDASARSSANAVDASVSSDAGKTR